MVVLSTAYTNLDRQTFRTFAICEKSAGKDKYYVVQIMHSAGIDMYAKFVTTNDN